MRKIDKGANGAILNFLFKNCIADSVLLYAECKDDIIVGELFQTRGYRQEMEERVGKGRKRDGNELHLQFKIW